MPTKTPTCPSQVALLTEKGICPVQPEVSTPLPRTGRRDVAMSIRKMCKAVVGNGAVILFVFTFSSLLFAQGGTWETKANMPTVRWASAAGVINDTFYVAGGYFSWHLKNVEAYDRTTDTWTIKSQRPTIQTTATAGVVNGILYTAGGTDCCVHINSTWAYDPIMDSWTQKASMSAPRSYLAAGVINGILYVAGGLNFSGPLATLEKYNPIANSWTILAPMPTARHGVAAGVVNDIRNRSRPRVANSLQ